MNAIRTLLHGIIDYAGLFPPAQLPMDLAVQNFAAYRSGDTASALGRFILPVGQLNRFEAAATEYLRDATTANPWRLSVLASADIAADVVAIQHFNERYLSQPQVGSALIDTIELKVESTEQIEAAVSQLPELVQPYFELPIAHDPHSLIKVVRRVGGRAKVRTGGTSGDAFPSVAELLRFIATCIELEVPFKATAGLHHPLRSVHRLTYAEDSPTGMMFGFFNVFVTAALLHVGAPREAAAYALEEQDPAAFHFEENSIRWRSFVIDLPSIAQARRLAISFGSCSFSEPITDLKAMNLL